MDDLITTVGSALDRSQKRKREAMIALLRSIYTRPGMIVLGVILLGAALALICPRTAPEREVNGVVIELESGEIVFGTGDGKRFDQEMLREGELRDKEMHLLGACALGVGAAACFVRAAMPWRKKERAERAPTFQQAVEKSAPRNKDGSREERQKNLKTLYEAGILSKEEYDARRKKL
jgi:hypothetical protein